MKQASQHIVITGIGIISSIGVGKEDFWDGLKKGSSGIGEITLFDTSAMDITIGGEIRNFEPKNFLGKKGLRLLDRATKLVCSASKMALDDARLHISDDNTYETGLVLGSTLGYIESFYNFQKDALYEGPHYVNPALFPNSVYNAPASHISIRFYIKGLNSTISTGYTSTIDALRYAISFLKLGRLKSIVLGTVESLSLPAFRGSYQSGLMAKETLLSCPFDKRRSGFICGEGAAVFVIETKESAIKRNAPVYGEIAGIGSGITLSTGNNHQDSRSLIKAMNQALTQSHFRPQDIDYICAHANSTKEIDRAEAQAIKSVFGHYAQTVPVSSIKSMIGETYSAGSALSLCAALGGLEKGFIPPTINYKQHDPECDLNCVPNKSIKSNIKTVMVNAMNPEGTSASLIVSRY
jgi:3-oxoacyl-[acyl-carrier-protein] synthase II